MEEPATDIANSARIEVSEQARESLQGILDKEGATAVRLFIEGFG
jgi:Fe-S cluster assembly iron-binding protein IscA